MKYRTLSLLGTGGIPYRKELREYAGSVTGSLLMQQLDYWFAHHPDGFYKFLDPTPKHPDYREGDSWTEELGFSKAEFRTAFDVIGVRHLSKSAYVQSPDKFAGKDGEKFYCSYHDKKNGLTWYFRNHPKVDHLIDELCKAKPAKYHKKPSSVDKQSESTGNVVSESTVNQESESTGNVVSESIEINNVDLHRSRNLIYIDQESESTFYIQKISSEINSEITHKSVESEFSNSETQPTNNTPDNKTRVGNSPITPPEVGYSAAALQNIYTKAVNVYELIDLFLLSPEISDASPPKEMMLVFSEKQKWHGWVLPWRSNKMHREFQNCNPEIVKKLATDLARKDKATPAQKYGHAIATINQWERTKGGWVNLMALCDRPILDQPSLSETLTEVSIPQYIKDWYEAQHEYHYRTQFLKAASLDDFFAGKDNRAWHQFAKEKFPSWDWTKTNPKIEDKTPCLLQTT